MYTRNFCDSYQRQCGHVRSVLKRHQCMLAQTFVSFFKLNCTGYMLYDFLPFWSKHTMFSKCVYHASLSVCHLFVVDLFVFVFSLHWRFAVVFARCKLRLRFVFCVRVSLYLIHNIAWALMFLRIEIGLCFCCLRVIITQYTRRVLHIHVLLSLLSLLW